MRNPIFNEKFDLGQTVYDTIKKKLVYTVGIVENSFGIYIVLDENTGYYYAQSQDNLVEAEEV